MSKVTTICCTRCGRELYESQSHPIKKTIKHVEFYELIGKDYLAEHYCPGCFLMSEEERENDKI